MISVAGLYYLAELVEEYSVIAKKCINVMIVLTTLFLTGFWVFEDLPFSLLIFGLVAQILHWVIIQTFPYVSFTSPSFILAIILVLVNHYLAFSFFGTTYHTFAEVLSYFTLCLWMVPFALFISLSANDNVLPTTTTRPGKQTLIGVPKHSDCIL